MVFGTISLETSDQIIQKCPLKDIDITGRQVHFFSSFSIKMTFQHEGNSIGECKYIFPTDLKICIYRTRFILNDEEIEMKLKIKEEAEKTYEEAKERNQTAVIGKSIPNGLSEFTIGSLQPGQVCIVILECSFTCISSSSKSCFFKFPLEVCTSSTKQTSLDKFFSGTFIFQYLIEATQELSTVSSNCGGKWNPELKSFLIEDIPKLSSIILTTEFVDEIQNCSVVSQNVLFTTIFPRFKEHTEPNSDFIFLVDCSGSMSGSRIQRAGECLQFFLRSLPTGCFFDIVCFGSTFTSYFNQLVEYNDDNLKKSINLASKLNANLGGTEILEPLLSIFRRPLRQHRVCQLFVISDGEVGNTDDVIASVSIHKNSYRIFTVGIGSGADAGLINGLADVSKGSSIFVSESADFTEVVIEQLQSAISSAVTDIQFYVEGIDSFETTPFPIPAVFNNNFLSVVSKLPENFKDNSILCSGYFGNSPIDLEISIFKSDQYKGILSNFAFNLMKDLIYQLNYKQRNREDFSSIK
jgi:hypothetical protein